MGDHSSPPSSTKGSTKRRSAAVDGKKDLIDLVGKDALINPPFTGKMVKASIPEHCFKRDIVKSFSYLAWDLIRIFILLSIGAYVHFNVELPLIISIPFWIVYGIVQGTLMTAVWVLAHECGHQAFSPYKWVNDTVGLVLHSALFVPYFSWRITHAAHHYYTGNLDRDEVHIPYMKEDIDFLLPWGTYRAVASFLKHSFLGWPAYLASNVSSNKRHEGHVDHFSPWSPLFRPEDRIYIVINDIALLLFGGFLFWCAQLYGFMAVLNLYFLPYIVVNFWLVTITKLQHSSSDTPYFKHSEWGWLKGQLTTVDRTYGKLLDRTLHHITDTHLVHHMYSKIPFYNASEATECVKQVIGKHYRYVDAPLWKQIWNVYSECVYVEKEGDAYWYWKE